MVIQEGVERRPQVEIVAVGLVPPRGERAKTIYPDCRPHTPQEVWTHFDALKPHLGRRLAFWEYLLGAWHRDGVLA